MVEGINLRNHHELLLVFADVLLKPRFVLLLLEMVMLRTSPFQVGNIKNGKCWPIHSQNNARNRSR